MSRIGRIKRSTLVAVVAAVGVAGGVASQAQAYTHSWSCSNAPSAGACYDASGTLFNPWEQVEAISGTHSEICAKAVTAAGNTRTGSGCAFNTSYRFSDIAGGTPDSRGYVYWAGPGGLDGVNGYAAT